MPDQEHLIQEQFVTKEENPSPEYQRLLTAYVANPLDDMDLRPEERQKLKESESQSAVSAE